MGVLAPHLRTLDGYVCTPIDTSRIFPPHLYSYHSPEDQEAIDTKNFKDSTILDMADLNELKMVHIVRDISTGAFNKDCLVEKMPKSIMCVVTAGNNPFM
jgi:hypothetical protein